MKSLMKLNQKQNKKREQIAPFFLGYSKGIILNQMKI